MQNQERKGMFAFCQKVEVKILTDGCTPLLCLLANARVLSELYSLESRLFHDEAGRPAGGGCGQHAGVGGPGERPVGASEAGAVGEGS